MLNPIFKDSKSMITFVVIVFFLFMKQFSVLVYMGNLQWDTAFFDSLITSATFTIIVLLKWYTIRYSKIYVKLNFTSLLNFLFLIWIFSIIWAAITYYLCYDLLYENVQYTAFLKETIIVRFFVGFFLISISALIYLVSIYYHSLNEKSNNEKTLIQKVKEAELNMLKSQINPHFLFNSLNSVSSLTITSPESAQEMVIKLSDYLRYSISNSEDKLQSFKNEIQNIERYLEIEKVRFGKRLQYSFTLGEHTENTLLPIMILQPLYENAVKHGVYESTEPINIQTIAALKGDALLIEISNNYENTPTLKKGAGIGINNIRERLKLIYSNDANLSISKTDSLFTVKLIIPQIKKGN